MPPPHAAVTEGSTTAAASPCAAAERTDVDGRPVVHIATGKQAWLEEDEGGGSSTTISGLIAEHAEVSFDRAAELVRFGAVYVGEMVDNNTNNIARNKAGEKQRRGVGARGSYTAGGAPSAAATAKMSAKAAQRPPFQGNSFEHMRLRRLDGSEALATPSAGSYLRVHCDPRTFSAARTTDWSKRVVALTADYVVIDKPAGVPTVPTIDNAVENALHQAGLAVAGMHASGRDISLLPPPPPPPPAPFPSLHAVSRLDVCTSGLVIFARNKHAAAALNQSFRDRKVSKRYLALLVPGPAVGAGPVAHCCRSKAFDGQRRPRIYADYDEELLDGGKWGGAWQEARSTVLLCVPATGAAAAAAVARDLAETEQNALVLANTAAGAAARLKSELTAGIEAAESSGIIEGVTGTDTAVAFGNVHGETKNGTIGSCTAASADTAATFTPASPAVSVPEASEVVEGRYYPHLCAIQLETGRTHQLRLQLAAMGAAVVGDTRYRGVVGRAHRGLPADDRTDIFGQEPEAIALQAARLEFEWGDSRVVYAAKRPTWALQDA